ncbi:MAG: 1-(5-phosphoribosyl)-5-[(5-phosphoribosylamino)methylideneamino]imidazole-4-carboxamide isomerase [Bacteroidota bacterium]
MKIIPAIDILDGKVVRLKKGDFTTAKSYSDNPLEQAKMFEQYNFDLIHIVDLSGSKEGKISAIKIIEEIKKNTKLKVEFGGGIRTINDVYNLYSIGVDKVIIGSLPFADRNEFEKIIQSISHENIIVAADTLRGEVVLKGWVENSNIEISSFISDWQSYGLKNFLITDIEKDGMLEGPNIRLYSALKEAFPNIYIIASGGIKDMADLEKLLDRDIDAVIVGKAIYENKIDLKELSEFGK